MLKIYIATPVNARRERTHVERFIAARDRVQHLKEVIAGGICSPDGLMYNVGKCVSTFDVNDSCASEAEAMGRCIELLMTCDAIYLDHGWLQSKGCNLEYRCAKIYGLTVFEHDKL